MVDHDLKMNESRAILMYLANAYPRWKHDPIYPKDPKKRARIDMLLYFDALMLYDGFTSVIFPLLFGHTNTLDLHKMVRLYEVLGWTVDFISQTGFAAGTNELTLADIAFMATLSTIISTGIVPDFNDRFPELKAYVRTISKLIPGIETANNEGAYEFGEKAKLRLPV